MSVRVGVSMMMLAATLSWPALAAGPQQGAAEGQGQTAPPASPGTEAGLSEKEAAGGLPILSGPESFVPGTVSAERSYFFPSLQIFGLADTTLPSTSGPRRYESEVSAVLDLAGERVGKHSRAVADYKGGVQVFNGHSNRDTTEHQLGLTWSYSGRRWGALMVERASLLPESAFGYAGFGWGGGLGLGIGGATGSNLAGLNPNFNPNQLLYSSRGTRIADATSVQVEYATSPRSSLSMTGGFGLLTSRTPGSTDAKNESFTVSYNHSLRRRDFVGVSYGLNTFQFQPIGESFKVHFFEFDYGHLIRGKVATEIGGGPQFSAFGTPLFGTSRTATWAGHGSVNWHTSRNAFALSAMRYTTNGGGVLPGSNAELLHFSWSRQLSRNWSGSLGPGYAHNTRLAQTILAGTSSSYDSVYAGASLGRAFGRNTTMFVNYTYQGQSSQLVCRAGSCSSSFSRQVFSVGLAWHRRQIAIE